MEKNLATFYIDKFSSTTDIVHFHVFFLTKKKKKKKKKKKNDPMINKQEGKSSSLLHVMEIKLHLNKG